MANIYCWSAAAGAGTGADWTNAYTTLKAAAEAAGTAAGDDIWIAHDHAETGAVALSITFKGTAAAPSRVICVNRAGSVPPVAADLRTTATVTTTGGSALTLTSGAQQYFEGITFSCGSGAVASVLTLGPPLGAIHIFRNCTFIKAGTTVTTSAITFGAERSRLIFYNCSFGFGNVGDGLCPIGDVDWIGGAAVVGATIPTGLVKGPGTLTRRMHCYGVDFSSMGANTIFAVPSTTTGTSHLINCKLGAATVIAATPTSSYSEAEAISIRADGAATNYRVDKYHYAGTQTTETTIVRTGGASDGTTPVAWKIVTSANAKKMYPFETLPITVWSDTTGAKTVSLYGYWDNAAVPNNDDIWMEATYLGTAGFPIASVVSSGLATVLSTNATIPSDASTWGGGDTTTRFKMGVSLTTALKGPISVVVKVGKASSTFYIDPKIEIV